jgi:hypothetical protein
VPCWASARFYIDKGVDDAQQGIGRNLSPTLTVVHGSAGRTH